MTSAARRLEASSRCRKDVVALHSGPRCGSGWAAGSTRTTPKVRVKATGSAKRSGELGVTAAGIPA